MSIATILCSNFRLLDIYCWNNDIAFQKIPITLDNRIKIEYPAMLFSLSYIINFVKDKNIASVTPTSRFGVKRILNKINFEDALTIIEYGPGTGVITKALLKKMPKNAKLVAIDTNATFIKILKKQIKDSRLHLFHDSAENVTSCLKKAAIKSADVVISGIPFSMIKSAIAKKIIEKTEQILNNDGKFIAYQCIVYQGLNKTDKNKKGINLYLPQYFQKIDKEAEVFNIPPLWIYEARKESSVILKKKVNSRR